MATLANKIALSLQALTLVLGISSASVAALAISAGPAYAATGDCSGKDANGKVVSKIAQGAACSQGDSQAENLFANKGVFTVIANTLIFLVGAISVIFIIIGGLRYVTSNGDSKNVTAAKDTILYAIIGVIVAVVSFAAVQFVIAALAKAK